MVPYLAPLRYVEVWAPTEKLLAYHAVLTYATRQNYQVSLPDIKCAFLNGDLTETVDFHPPPGVYICMLWILLKALYGLK
jgi:hypothetical protein